jgi:hypothetical protein
MSDLQKRHKLNLTTGLEHDDKLVQTWRCPHMVDRRHCSHCFTAFELDPLVSTLYTTNYPGNNKKRNRDDVHSNENNNPAITYQFEQYDGESKYNE